MSLQAMPAAPKLAWRTTLLGDCAIKPRVTNGAARALVPRVLRKERRVNVCLEFISAEQALSVSDRFRHKGAEPGAPVNGKWASQGSRSAIIACTTILQIVRRPRGDFPVPLFLCSRLPLI